MAKNKATKRRIPASARRTVRKKTIKLFKIKKILPQQKTIGIKKSTNN